jgi:hypothetical protein
MRGLSKAFLVAAALGFSVFFLACASTADAWREMDDDVLAADWTAALARLPADGKKNSIYKKNNVVSLRLDRGLLEHYAGNHAASYRELLAAEALIEEARVKSVSAEAASWLTNDNAKDYAGEDYEDIYVNIFNALNAYRLGNGNAYALVNGLVAAGGELQRLAEKYGGAPKKAENALSSGLGAVGTVFSLGTIDWPPQKKITLTDSALARYLAAIFATQEAQPDNAAFQLFGLKNALATPLYADIKLPPAFEVSGERGYEVSPFISPENGKGTLNILAFAGLSPVKVEKIDVALFPFLKYSALQTANLKTAALLKRPSKIAGIRARAVPQKGIGSNPAPTENVDFNLFLIEDIGGVMEDTYNGHQNDVYMKLFIQTLLRYIPADIAAASIEKENDSPFLAEMTALAARVAIEAISQADIRAGRYFPGRALAGTAALDPGVYSLQVFYFDNRGDAIFEETLDGITVRNGQVQFVESICLK